jgi:hypothetical protein
VLLLVLVAPVVALATVLFLARVEERLAADDGSPDEDESRRVGPARHPSA